MMVAGGAVTIVAMAVGRAISYGTLVGWSVSAVAIPIRRRISMHIHMDRTGLRPLKPFHLWRRGSPVAFLLHLAISGDLLFRSRDFRL